MDDIDKADEILTRLANEYDIDIGDYSGNGIERADIDDCIALAHMYMQRAAMLVRGIDGK